MPLSPAEKDAVVYMHSLRMTALCIRLRGDLRSGPALTPEDIRIMRFARNKPRRFRNVLDALRRAHIRIVEQFCEEDEAVDVSGTLMQMIDEEIDAIHNH